MEKVLITPHTAGKTCRYEDNVLAIMQENLAQLWRGETELLNQVVYMAGDPSISCPKAAGKKEADERVEGSLYRGNRGQGFSPPNPRSPVWSTPVRHTPGRLESRSLGARWCL